MTAIPPIGGGLPQRDDRAQLRQVAHDLEGVFIAQLFQAMRASVPQGGLTEADPGRDMFNALLDDRLASEAARRMSRGMGEALYRQLSSRVFPESTPAGGAE